MAIIEGWLKTSRYHVDCFHPSTSGTIMRFFSLISIISLIFALLAVVGASNPVEPRGMRQGKWGLSSNTKLETSNHTLLRSLIPIPQTGIYSLAFQPVDIVSIITSAIDTIVRAGGKVTHRFKKLIKYLLNKTKEAQANSHRGFSVDAPPDVVNLYSTTSEAQQWGIMVEEDEVVGIVGQDRV
jgi:hypothetical protein